MVDVVANVVVDFLVILNHIFYFLMLRIVLVFDKK
mgnify:FL=1